MKVKLPVVIKNEIVDKKHVFETEEKEFDVDMSLACQMRWETKFPELAEIETVIDYATRTSNLKSQNAAVILSKLKFLYCLFDTEMSFIQFVKMFDFTNEKYVKGLLDRIQEIFSLVMGSSSEKN
ncbi:MAG: hypothetical protein OSJ39_01920 [Clostridia bacterium]|nr:hypothetical protein [Clostridia bacterium]